MQEKFLFFIKYTDINIHLFKVVSEADKYGYTLPTKMANFVKTYVKDALLKQQMLLQNPVLDNLNQAKTLDEFLKRHF